MLETLREFGEHTFGVDERRAARRGHAYYFMELAERAAPQLVGPDQVEWLDRLHNDQDNVREALISFKRR